VIIYLDGLKKHNHNANIAFIDHLSLQFISANCDAKVNDVKRLKEE
jgi:hypothetical protein